MKRVFKYLGAVLAGALVLSSCVEEEKIVFNPEAGAAQVLGEIQGCTLEAEGPAIETTYAEVDFGVDVPVVYTLNIAASGAEEINTKLSATIANGKVSFAQKDINAAILNMGGTADVEFAVDFQLAASMANDKGAAIKGDESYVKYSNVVTAKFVPYSTTVLDVDKFDHLWVIGAAESIGAWAHDKVYQYLYNYNGDGITYTGMIYYTDGASGGWKITGIAGWDDSCNWGSEDNSADEAEASALKLISSGGSQDIKCYSKPYYMWTFNKESFELKKEFGFTTIGIVGSFNEWNEADESCVMTYNAYYHRFYIDYEFAADGELKFAADGEWDLNFGEGMAINGGNIPVAAGKYRIYLDFNKNEYTFDANMYGKEEPGASPVAPGPEEPEPDPVVGWGLVGEYNGWGAEADVMLASDGTFLTAKGVALSGQVKFRKDGDWAVNFGAPGEVEPVEIAVNTELELVANGKNFTIAEGTYDVYLDEANAKAWFINDGSYPGGGAAPVESEWGLIGSLAACNNWSKNITLFEDGDFYSAKGVTFADNDQFKFRKGETWGTEVVYEGIVAPDAEYACAAGGGNSTISAGGIYDVYLAKSLDKFYVMTQGKKPADAGQAEVVYVDPSGDSFVVGFSGSVLGWDDPSFDQNDRASLVSKNVTDATSFAGAYEFKLDSVTFAAADEFKVRINGQWIGVGGAAVEGLAVSGTNNFVADEAGTYSAVITFDWDGTAHSNVKVVFSK